jgi:hypothetical protein
MQLFFFSLHLKPVLQALIYKYMNEITKKKYGSSIQRKIYLAHIISLSI